MVDRPMATRSLPAVSTLTATAIVVADVIGVGVFTSLGFQARDVPSGCALVLLWAIGGVVALCGALCYAELATMFPRSGGRVHGGWLSATVGFAAPVALAAMAFGQYAEAALPGAPALLLGLAVIGLSMPPWGRSSPVRRS